MTHYIPLTPEVLKALAHGLYDLNKGDRNDWKTADAVKDTVFKSSGLVPEGQFDWVHRSEATGGYVPTGKLPGAATEAPSVYAFVNAEGEWGCPFGPIPAGTPIYQDPDCTALLRHV